MMAERYNHKLTVKIVKKWRMEIGWTEREKKIVHTKKLNSEGEKNMEPGEYGRRWYALLSPPDQGEYGERWSALLSLLTRGNMERDGLISCPS